MNMGLVNIYGFLMVLPIAIVFTGIFIIFWNIDQIVLGFHEFLGQIIWILVVGIVIHELLHGLTWGIFAKKGLKSIHFGINWKYLTPYCHCGEPLKVKQYRLGVVMPLFILGILPFLVSLLLGNGYWFFFSLFFTWSAGGDIIGLWMLRKIKPDQLVSDHPEKMGFYIESDKAV